MSLTAIIHKAGASPIGVWAIKHIVSPADRTLYRLTGGRFMLSQGKKDSVVLLTTVGRRSGKKHTSPVFHLRDGNRFIVCNVNPGFEKTNPWVLNARATPLVHVQYGSHAADYAAREATTDEIEHYWPALVKIWPAYQEHFERSGRRAIFILEPICAA